MRPSVRPGSRRGAGRGEASPTRRRDWGEAELDLALQAADCPACVLAAQTEQAILSWMANVNIREAATVRKLVQARGLCGLHWEALLGLLGPEPGRAAVGVLQRISAATIEDLDRGVGPFGPKCPICESRERRARSTLVMVLERLDEHADRLEFEQSFGLCQGHLASAFSLRPSPQRARVLLAAHRVQLQRQSSELGEAAARGNATGRRARELAAKLAGPQRSLNTPNGGTGDGA